MAQLYVSIRDRNLPENQDLTGDPWNGRTLEWATSSPPPFYNFANVPVVHELDAYSHMKDVGLDTEAVATYTDIHMPRNTSAGLFIAGFSFLLGFGGVWHIWWLAILGLAGAIGVTILRSFDNDTDYYVPAAEVARIEAAHATRVRAQRRARAMQEPTHA